MVAVHRDEVSAPSIVVLHPLPIRVGHLAHTSPAIVYIVHGELVYFIVVVRKSNSAGFLRHITQCVVGTFVTSTAISDRHQASRFVTRIAVVIFHVVAVYSICSNITLTGQSAVCVVVINFAQAIIFENQITSGVVLVLGDSCIGVVAVHHTAKVVVSIISTKVFGISCFYQLSKIVVEHSGDATFCIDHLHLTAFVVGILFRHVAIRVGYFGVDAAVIVSIPADVVFRPGGHTQRLTGFNGTVKHIVIGAGASSRCWVDHEFP